MKTVVIIEWDKPEEQFWLCPDNIKIALSRCCKNTKFEVRALDDETIKEYITEYTKRLIESKGW